MTFDWWTIGLQAVNVAVLVWLLQYFFWKPVAGVIAQRRALAQEMLDEATDKEARADAALADIAATRAGFAAERAAILAEAQAEAAHTHSAAIAAAKREAEVLMAAARAAIAHDTDQAQKTRADNASKLAVDIARRLATRLQGPAVDAAFRDWLIEAIGALGVEMGPAALGEDATVELRSANAIASADKARISKALTSAFGMTPKINCVTDPSLVAGHELHGPHFTLRNSWQADLERITKGLHDAE